MPSSSALRPISRPLVLVVSALPLTGCVTVAALRAGEPVVRCQLEAPYDLVWQAARSAIEPAALRQADPATGLMETGWYEGSSARTQGVLFGGGAFHRRVRYRLRLAEQDGLTTVSVLVRSEEKAPGGLRALRWERVPPSPEQLHGMCEAIATQLERVRAADGSHG